MLVKLHVSNVIAPAIEYNLPLIIEVAPKAMAPARHIHVPPITE